MPVQLDLQHLLRLARRWWWLLLLAPLIGGLAAAYASGRQPNLYSAQATLLIDAGAASGNDPSSLQVSRNLTDTYSMWIVSAPVLERAANEMGLQGGAGALTGSVTANTVGDTLFIRVSAVSTDPQQAALIANTVSNQFVLYVQEQFLAQNAQARSKVDAQIDETGQQIADVDLSVQELQQRGDDLSASEQQQLDTLLNTRAQLLGDLSQLQTVARSMDVNLASAQTRIMMSSPATVPGAPFAPQSRQSIALGFMAGAALAIGAIALFEYLDNTVRSREEIAQLTGMPVLASIPVADIQRSGRQLFVLGEPRAAPSEAVRLLRANLEFASAAGPLRSLAISSPRPGEGKSTVTANLGVVMAQAGLETVIIDADLRRPTQHQIFGVNNDRGLSMLIAHHEQPWREAAVRLNIPRLTLIPSGPMPPNPSDLLSLDRFRQILSEIGDSVDIVLIDTSPMLSVSDALVVAMQTDATILVCKTGQTRRDSLHRATTLLSQGSIRLAGIVVNHEKRDATDAYYGRDVSTSPAVAARYFYGVHSQDTPASRSRRESPANGTASSEDQRPALAEHP